MEEMKMSVKEICGLKDKLLCEVKNQLNQGISSVNTNELGAAIDMIKDLAEAEEKCYKACYYKMKIMSGMMEDDDEEMPMSGRMGYDNWRYSSGRFAPTGRGHRAGYVEGMNPWTGDGSRKMEDPWKNQEQGTSGTRGDYTGFDGRMGYTRPTRGDHYERYRNARMGYHESKDAASKEHMDAATRDYVVDMAETVKEMWKDADPAMRKELKNKFVALTSELN